MSVIISLRRISVVLMGVLLTTVPRAQAVTFYPTVADMVTTPGGEATAAFAITNDGAESQDYVAELYAVTFDGEQHTPQFSPLSADIRAWFRLSPQRFTLPAGGDMTVRLTASIPSDIPPQTLVLGVLTREVVLNGGSTVASGVSGLVFVTIGSPTTDLAMTFANGRGSASHLPFPFTLTVNNNGERVGQPEGTIVIRNMLGKVVAEVPVNAVQYRVLPGQTRTYTAQWGEEGRRGFFHELWREATDFKVGRFTAELVVAPYPGAAEVVQGKTAVVLFPWRLALAGAVIVLGVGGALALRRRTP